MRSVLARVAFGLAWVVGAGAVPADAQTLYTVSRDDDQIRTLNYDVNPWVFGVAKTLVLPPPAVVVGAWGLADDPLSNGELWILFETADGAAHRRLGKIEVSSCSATECSIDDRGDLGDRFEALASLCDGDLYGVTGEVDSFGVTTETLFHRLESCTLDLCSPVLAVPLGNGGPGEAIAIREYDLFHASGESTFERLNFPTASLVDIGVSGGTGGFGQAAAMTWFPAQSTFLLASISNMYRIHVDGALSEVAVTGLMPINGLALLDVPCPTIFADGFETNGVLRWSSSLG